MLEIFVLKKETTSEFLYSMTSNFQDLSNATMVSIRILDEETFALRLPHAESLIWKQSENVNDVILPIYSGNCIVLNINRIAQNKIFLHLNNYSELFLNFYRFNLLQSLIVNYLILFLFLLYFFF